MIGQDMVDMAQARLEELTQINDPGHESKQYNLDILW